MKKPPECGHVTVANGPSDTVYRVVRELQMLAPFANPQMLNILRGCHIGCSLKAAKERALLHADLAR
jgi:hypothetical protein